MEASGAATGLISKTHLIDFSLCHPFVFLFDESTDMHHMSHVAAALGGGSVNEHVIILSSFVFIASGTAGGSALHYKDVRPFLGEVSFLRIKAALNSSV